MWPALAGTLLAGMIALNGCAKPKEETPNSRQRNRGADGSGSGEDSGVYVGVLSFADKVYPLGNGQLLLLDADREAISEALSGYALAERSGTSLYYAVHQALTELENQTADFNANITSVNLLVFTDGLDNNSTSLGLPDLNSEESFKAKPIGNYKRFVEDKIKTVQFGDPEKTTKPVSLTSYAVGVQGNDVDDANEFKESLSGLASSKDNVYPLANIDELNKQFKEIANTLIDSNQLLNFTLQTPSYPHNTEIRLTFDVSGEKPTPGDMQNSKQYIQGKIYAGDEDYTLEDVTLVGFPTLGQTTRWGGITGTFDETEVNYAFDDLQVADIKWENIKQWYREPGGNWRRNSEYNTDNKVTLSEKSKLMVIYLVLDCSTSLSETDVEKVKESAEGFIELLYEKIESSISNSGAKGAPLRSKRHLEDEIIAGEPSNWYHFTATPGQYIIKWNDALEGDGKMTCDVQVSIFQNTEALYYQKDSGYNDPPVVSVQENSEILIEVKGFKGSSGTYEIWYEKLSDGSRSSSK